MNQYSIFNVQCSVFRVLLPTLHPANRLPPTNSYSPLLDHLFAVGRDCLQGLHHRPESYLQDRLLSFFRSSSAQCLLFHWCCGWVICCRSLLRHAIRQFFYPCFCFSSWHKKVFSFSQKIRATVRTILHFVEERASSV